MYINCNMMIITQLSKQNNILVRIYISEIM